MLERRAVCKIEAMKIKSNTDDIGELKKTVYGNGTKGIKEEVTILKTQFHDVGRAINVGFLVVSIIQIVGMAMLYFFRKG
jgi:uncharacterized membrane protein YukC